MQDPVAGWGEELVLQQLADVLLVDKGTFFFRRANDSDGVAVEFFGIEVGIHGEAGAEESDFFQAEGFCMFGGGADDAEERDRRAAFEFGEDDVWGVGGDESKSGSGASEDIDAGGEIVGKVGVAIGVEESDAVVDVEAVNEELRGGVVGIALAIESDDGAVVVDGGLGAKATEDAGDFHVLWMMGHLSGIRRKKNL